MNFHEEIAKVAYELHEKSGQINGCNLDHWLEAERIVTAVHKDRQKEKEPVVHEMKGKKPAQKTGRKVRSKAGQATVGT